MNTKLLKRWTQWERVGWNLKLRSYWHADSLGRWQEISCGLPAQSLHIRLWMCSWLTSISDQLVVKQLQGTTSWGRIRGEIDKSTQRPAIVCSNTECVCMRGYMSSSVREPVPGNSKVISHFLRPNLLAAESAALSGAKLWLWTGLISSWLQCPLQQAPTSTEYSCAWKTLWQGKRSGNVQFMYSILVVCSCVCLYSCQSVYIRLMSCDTITCMCWPLSISADLGLIEERH